MATSRATTPGSTPTKDTQSERNDAGGKVIHDPIHGLMPFHPILVKIIDTPEFQRLRDIKHLGGTCYVYPGGVHSRFEHALGTSFLCHQAVKVLQENYDCFTKKDIICLRIAGLCHDLGHGPFSRVYQNQFLLGKKNLEWNRSEASVAMFERVLDKQQHIKEAFESLNIEAKEIQFIKDAMQGIIPEATTRAGRGRFLYEIVKNRRFGVDCDLIDSILRDCHYVGIKCNFNYGRYFMNIQIVEVGTLAIISVTSHDISSNYSYPMAGFFYNLFQGLADFLPISW